jgi:hypothetical protein
VDDLGAEDLLRFRESDRKVASANPHTIVVLETGTAVTMPWIDKVAGVIEASQWLREENGPA